MIDTQRLKCCSVCGEEKPLEDFSPGKSSIDGCRSICKPCAARYVRERRARLKHVVVAEPVEQENAVQPPAPINDQIGDQYLTTTAIARRIGTSRHKVKGDIHRGKLQAFRGPNVHGRGGFEFRVTLEDAEAYIAANGLNRQAPPLQRQKPMKEIGTPDLCGACGTDKGNIVFDDVGKMPGKKNGWLCMNCYKLVRASQGNKNRIQKVLQYLEQIS